MEQYIILLFIVGVATLFAYRAGASKAEANVNKENLNALNKALKARRSIKSPDDARRVLMEHAVDKLPIISDSKIDGK